ncbi:hypothetical protein [Anaeromicrobium sediminis]|uniref:DUF948 domain-containing protein n=1 Tax=Anaeromicrobium sediminis TaxID=1478221 RepID=A0A267MGS9_9FIRM|nr:hypothetical protein [Anaeromicrobium sediminis]PAB58085.1 hypothetical protein CCE28_17270 [Anaeromicrobium sediminis]
MNIQISLLDLGIIIMGILGIILLGYAIIVLKNFNDSLKVVKNLIESNEKNIQEIIDQAPDITTNLNSLSSDISTNVRAAQGTINNILGTGEIAASQLAEHSGVISQALGLLHILQKARDVFTGFIKK